MLNGVNIRDLNGVEASTAHLPLVGYTVFWRLTGIRVSHPDLEHALKATGFEKYLPDPPTPRVALRRALTEWIKAKHQIARSPQLQRDDDEQDGNNGIRRRTLIRVINRAGSEHLVYALVAEDVDFSVLGLSYGTALRILLHKKTGEMICTTDAEGVIDAQRESRRVTDELAPYWRQYQDLFISRDLSQMMREIVNGMSAVSLRREGGLYFVPASERDSLLRLRQLITGIPQVVEQDPFVCALGVPDAVEAKRSLLREKTITQRLVIYKRLKAKAEMYQDLLGMQQDQVRASIAGLEREALNLLAAEADPPTSPISPLPVPLLAEAGIAAD
jgi:hypothetical protein